MSMISRLYQSLTRSNFMTATLLMTALAVSAQGAMKWRVIPQHAFGVGEKLTFDIGWKTATAGSVTLSITEKNSRKNRAAYKIVCDASTNQAIDLVYKVRDHFESWMDAQALCSLGSARRTDEGGRVKIEDVFIDPAGGTFKSRSTHPKKSAAATLEEGRVPAYAQDVISTLYYVRAQPLKIGSAVDVVVMNGTDFHDVRFQIRRSENLKTVIGTIRCLVLEPLFKTEQGFGPNPNAAAFIWVTDDARHLPVKISAELPFGHIDATLANYKPN